MVDGAGRESLGIQINRRAFCRAASLGLGGLIIGKTLGGVEVFGRDRGALPPPMITGVSTELCFNSRASVHSGLTGTASDQQLANVLWAAGRAPFVGSHREIYVATSECTYLYQPETHSLQYHSGTTTSNAFRITYDRELDFDAGVSYMTALAASVSLWNGTDNQLASCPIGSGLSFGIRSVNGHTDELLAVSSDASLPNPTTDGDNGVEQTLANLRLCKSFHADAALTQQQMSQILWGAYGCTPHIVNSGRAGLTVPSSWARYQMTNRIYVIQEKVWRYANRQGDDLTTQDHRLELVHDGDVRDALRQALPDMPAAPCYVLFCLTPDMLTDWYSRIETGFAAGAMLVQTVATGLSGDLMAPLSSAQQTELQTVAHLPAADHAHAAAALGRRLADLDDDGDVDLSDLAQLLSNYGETSGMNFADGDLNGDGAVDLSDLAALLGQYGAHP